MTHGLNFKASGDVGHSTPMYPKEANRKRMKNRISDLKLEIAVKETSPQMLTLNWQEHWIWKKATDTDFCTMHILEK